MQVGQASAPMQELLGENLKQADNLRLGQLENGLRYVMLPNKVPPQRFEAHLEMHAGWYACRHACKKEPISDDCLVFAKLVVPHYLLDFVLEAEQVMHCSTSIIASIHSAFAQISHVHNVYEQMAVGTSGRTQTRTKQMRPMQAV